MKLVAWAKLGSWVSDFTVSLGGWDRLEGWVRLESWVSDFTVRLECLGEALPCRAPARQFSIVS